MLIHSNLENDNNNDNSENIDFDNLCSICYDSLDEETVVTLKCGHKYHYNCISMTYKSINKRHCPYCRGDGGFLTLLPGKMPIKNIHLEYNKEGNYNLEYIPGKCKYMLKRGKNSGSQCNFNSKTEDGYCSRHHKLVSNKNSN